MAARSGEDSRERAGLGKWRYVPSLHVLDDVALVTSKQLTANSAIIAACAHVPLDFMMELDGFDGMRLMKEAKDFFPTDLQANLSPPTPQS